MKLNLRTLSPRAKLRGKPVLVRLDWNIPLSGPIEREASIKIERSIPFLRSLQKRGAIVIVLTHLGRPTKKDKRLSTQQLVHILKDRYGLDMEFHPESVAKKNEQAKLKAILSVAKPGSLHILENVRFLKAEEEDSRPLALAYAELGDLFINDAFASSHRAHVSVVGIAKVLASYAGPNFEQEVAALSKILNQPKQPVVAVVGGLKLKTKLPLIEALCRFSDQVLIGGAMATPFFKARKMEVGKSVYDKKGIPAAAKLLKRKEIVLPTDVIVTTAVTKSPRLRRTLVTTITKKEMIVDVGPETLKAWGAIIKKAKTIVWNGPVGLVECKPCGFGSRFLARVIATRATGPAYGVVGGGDTLPVIAATKTEKLFDFVSTGGGAMLEFIAKQGKLPGVMALLR